MKKLLIISMICTLFFTINCVTVVANDIVAEDVKTIDTKISEEDLKSDLDFLIKTIEDVHPNSYAYIDKDKFYKELKQIKAKIDKPMNSIDFYKLVSPLITKLKDGHTNIIMPKNLYYQYLIENDKAIFPLLVEVRDNKIYVKDNLINDIDIPIGSEILAINGANSSKIITNLLKYETGMNDFYKQVKLQSEFSDLLWLEYNYIDQYKITYKYKNTKKTVNVRGIKVDEYNNYWSNQMTNQGNFSYKILDDNICYLNFRSFRDYDSFEVLLDNMFNEMKEKNIENLIIDIRQNGGGNSCLGDLLLSYLYDKPYYMFSKIDIKVSKQILDKKILNTTEDKLGKVLSFDITPNINSSKKDKFKGRVCLLTSRYTFSSATDLASVIKDFNVGVIIGEETGGIASSYGDVYYFQLPNTNINCGVSYKYFTRPNGDKSLHGVLPDKEVKQSYKDSANNTDTVLNFAKQFILNDYDKVFSNIKKNPTFEVIKVTGDKITSIKNTLVNFFKHTYAYDYDSASLMMSEQLKNYFNKDNLIAASKTFKAQIGKFKSVDVKEVFALIMGDNIYEYEIKAAVIGDKANINMSIKLDNYFKIIQIITN